MGSWHVLWNFEKSSYVPGEQVWVSFWIENVDNTGLYLSNLELEFDFGTYNLESISGTIMPRETEFLGRINLLLPNNVVGRKNFAFSYRMYEYLNNGWVDLGLYRTERLYFVSIYPKPYYKAFLSRGLSIEDRAIGDPIAEFVREWALETVTVGIEVQVPEEQVAVKARAEIAKSDAVIAIATPRFLDALTGLWRTFEWYHGECGIAFGIDKPLLILKDKRVVLGGLPSYLADTKPIPLLEFDTYNLPELTPKLSAIMPSFREWLETKRRKEYFNILAKVAIGGLAVVGAISILNGVAGSLSGSSEK
jgi:hypothetical protein